MKEQAGQPVFDVGIDELLTERIVAHSRATVSPQTPAREAATDPAAGPTPHIGTGDAPCGSPICKPKQWAIAAALALTLVALILYRLRRRQ